MTTEQKAAAYEETLKRAREVSKNPNNAFCEKVLLEIFPELGEDEDEKIIKALLHLVKTHKELSFGITNYKGVQWLDMLAWLERQKPVESVNGEDYGIDGLWHAQRILEKTFGKVDGYQSDDGILDHKAAIGAIKTITGKKPAVWTEEDEKMYQAILQDFVTIQKVLPEFKVQPELDWFKSLYRKIEGLVEQ